MTLKRSTLTALVAYAAAGGYVAGIPDNTPIEKDEVDGYLKGLKQLHPAEYETLMAAEAPAPAVPAAEKKKPGRPKRVDRVEPAAAPPEILSTGKPTPLEQSILDTIPLVTTRNRFRDADGQYHDLELFSTHPKHGNVFRFPVPSDIREFKVKGQTFKADLVTLRGDPDGTTNGVANSKLLVIAELMDI